MLDVILSSQSISTLFQDHLIEILLSIILFFNVSAYKLLYNKIDELEEEVEMNSEFRNVTSRRLFGYDQGTMTQKGLFQQTEDEFESFRKKLDDISEMITEESEQRQEEFKMIEGQLDQIVDSLHEEENLDIDKSDIKKNRQV